MEKEELYIGTKIIKAVTSDKDGQTGYKVIYPGGYISWSPKETFENAYRLITDSEKELLAIE